MAAAPQDITLPEQAIASGAIYLAGRPSARIIPRTMHDPEVRM
jgi:hypothetical protein